MGPDEIHHLVTATGRISAGLFVMALVEISFHYRATSLWLAFLTVHTVHFAFVVWFVRATGGVDLFPGGRDLADSGGWPTILAIFALFYALAFVRFFAVGASAGAALRLADQAAVTVIGLFFLATYLPLIARSWIFALPAVVIAGALILFWMRTAPSYTSAP